MRLAAAILFSSLALAQDIEQASKSPLLLAGFVNQHKLIDWERLWSALDVPETDALRVVCGRWEGNPCSAQILSVAHPAQAFVIIQGELLACNDIFLRYTQNANGDWEFAGEFRSFAKEYPRHHEIIQLGGEPFLAISSDHSQVGAAHMERVEDLFDLTQPGFEPVFSYWAEGGDSPFSFAVGHTVRARYEYHNEPGIEKIDLILDVHFDGPGFHLPAKFVGTYDRPSGQKKFTLRLAYSGLDRIRAIPTEEFDDLAGVDGGPSNEQLLVYAFPELKKIASGSEKDAREWLDSVLKYAGDTREKTQLLEVLKAKQPN